MARFNFLADAALTACIAVSCVPALAAEPEAEDKPAQVEDTADATIKKVTLAPKAAERLGIQIDEVRVEPAGRRVVPYSAILYGLTGQAWVYISVDPLTFVRGAVTIDTIKGENVYLSDGPPPGTKVLAAGVQQVFGAEVGVGH